MKTKAIILCSLVAVFLLIIATAVMIISNSRNKRYFDDQKIQCESLVTENLQSQLDLDKAKSDLAAMTTKEEQTVQTLSVTKSRLAADEKKLAHILKENSALIKERNDPRQKSSK